ncbi:hypothetical protein KAI46_04550, partial [bacterium]|nr:hypothetical protein [bacterium]
AVVFSTSTRNFDNRLGNGAKVYLGSAELAAVSALFGRLPTVSEYQEIVGRKLTPARQIEVYKYLDFSQIQA